MTKQGLVVRLLVAAIIAFIAVCAFYVGTANAVPRGANVFRAICRVVHVNGTPTCLVEYVPVSGVRYA